MSNQDYTYAISSSLVFLQRMLGPFRWGDSKDKVSMLAGSSSDSMTYLMSNMILPLTLLLLWTVGMAAIYFNGRYCCYTKGVLFRVGERPTIPLFDDEDVENGELEDLEDSFDLVTIASDDEMVCKGSTEDQVKYEVLCEQMRRIRNVFSSLVVVMAVLSIPAMWSCLHLKHELDHIWIETNHMIYRLHTAGEAMAIINGERNSLLEINTDIVISLESASLQNCFKDELLINATNELSSSVQDLNETIQESNLQFLEETYHIGEHLSNDAKRSLHVLVYLLWILPLSIVFLNLASMALLHGTSIAKKNVSKRWHHVVFQEICLPLLIFMSMLLVISFASLVLVSVMSVDFCINGGGPSNSILEILDIKGLSNSVFYDTTYKVMQRDCVYDNSTISMYDTFRQSLTAVGKIDAFVPSSIEDECSDFSQFASLMSNFTNISSSTLKSANIASYVSQCANLHNWFTDVVSHQTCTSAPRYLPISLLFLLFLVLISIVMVTVNIAWKTNIQLFQEIYSASENDQIQALDGDADGRKIVSSKWRHQHRGLQIEAKNILIDEGDDNRSERYDKRPYDTTSYGGSSYDTRSYDEPDTNVETTTNKNRRDPKEGDISSVLADALELTELEMIEAAERMMALSDYHKFDQGMEVDYKTGQLMHISSGNIVAQEALYNDQRLEPPHTHGHIHIPSQPQFAHQIMHNDAITGPQQHPGFIIGNDNKQIGPVNATNTDKNKNLNMVEEDTLEYSSSEHDDSSDSSDDDDSNDLTHKKRNQSRKRRSSERKRSRRHHKKKIASNRKK